MTEETYCVRFQSVAYAWEESYTKMATRVMDLAQKWMQNCADVDEVQEVIAVEQLLNSGNVHHDTYSTVMIVPREDHCPIERW